MVGEEEKRRDHSADIAGEDPPVHEGEDGAIAPIRGTLALLRVIPKFHEPSTQEIEMNLCSGSRDMMIPSIMHMRIASHL